MIPAQRYLLDTNVASYIIRGNVLHLNEKLTQLAPHQICISAVTEAELRYGLLKKGSPKALSALIESFLEHVTILPWDSEAVLSYAHLRMALEKQGLSLSPEDLMIAAHSLAHDAILITHDQAFFKASELLTLEDWC